MKSTELKIAHLNVGSLPAHVDSVAEVIDIYHLDILAVTETWLTGSIDSALVDIQGYVFIRKDYRGRGSGVGMYIRQNIPFSILPTSDCTEQLGIIIKIKSFKCCVCVMYRNFRDDYKTFLSEFESTVTACFLDCENILVLGDMNVDMYKAEDPEVVQYINLINDIGLFQLVDEATRVTGTTQTLIDHLLVSNIDFIGESAVFDTPYDFFDHDIVYCTLRGQCVPNSPSVLYRRDTKNFLRDSLYSDLISSGLDSLFYVEDVNCKVAFFTNTLLALFDKHAPFRNIRITKKAAPWLTDNLKFLIELRNKAKSRYRRLHTSAAWDYYRSIRNYTNVAIKNEKKAYFAYSLNSTNPRAIYKELRSLNVCRRRELCLPDSLNNADEINDYFLRDVHKTPHDTSNTAHAPLYQTADRCPSDSFGFHTVDQEAVLQALLDVKSNACGSDGLTSGMLRDCCPFILPHLTNIINSCILEHVFPESWKTAEIFPLPKTNNPTSIEHLRPVSILPVLSKVLEKILLIQLKHFLDSRAILPENQSGFRSNHSCTTTLADVTDDILRATDDGKLTVLILLDFSRAFDTIDHNLLCQILRFIGLDTGAVALLRSFLTDRKQLVKLGGVRSNEKPVTRGAPQGSILSPTLFTIYTHLFSTFVKHCKVHSYADDTQLYFSFDEKDVILALRLINEDLAAISDVADQHRLVLNPAKTQAIVFGSPAACGRVGELLSLRINGTPISFVPSVKNLGLHMDNSFRYRTHINKCIGRAYGSLKMLYPYRRYLPLSTKRLLCSSLVLSQLDYCSQIFAPSLDSNDRQRVQRLQNSCLRFCFGIRKFQRVSHKLTDIKWLNMEKRFLLRASVFFHKIIIYKQPPYLYRKIRFRTDVHNLNLRRKGLIYPPTHRYTLFQRSFTFQVYKTYNSVPDHFKSLSVPSLRSAMFRHLLDLQTQVQV